MDALTAMTRALAKLEDVDPELKHRTEARRLITALWREGFDIVADGTGGTAIAAEVSKPLGDPETLRLGRAAY